MEELLGWLPQNHVGCLWEWKLLPKSTCVIAGAYNIFREEKHTRPSLKLQREQIMCKLWDYPMHIADCQHTLLDQQRRKKINHKGCWLGVNADCYRIFHEESIFCVVVSKKQLRNIGNDNTWRVNKGSELPSGDFIYFQDLRLASYLLSNHKVSYLLVIFFHCVNEVKFIMWFLDYHQLGN